MAESNTADPSSDVFEVDLLTIWKTLLKHLQTIATVVVLCVTASIVYSYTAVPVYDATARILVEAKPPKIVKVEDVVLPNYNDSDNFFNSQVEILKSHTVAELVYRDLKTYEPWERRGKDAAKLKPITETERVDALLEHVKISPVRMTQVIDVAVEDPDPVLAARIANDWAKAYVLFSSLDQLVQRRSELESDLATQSKFLKGKHPIIVGIQTEIDTVNAKISSEKQRLGEEDNETVFSNDVSNVKILDRAQVASKPVRPRKMFNLAIAMILGLFAGAGLAIMFESFDQTIKSPSDLEAFLKVLCLMPIPLHIVGNAKTGVQPEFVTERDRHSAMAESFRSLRTGIVFSNPDLAKKSFLITSSAPSEGKTTVAVNLATVFAQADERVILVDADLRSPRIHSVFGFERNNGVTDILALGKDDIHAFIHKTDVKNLDVLTCGELPPNPSELLGSKKMTDLIERLSRDYDRIVFDTPPVMAATDAVVLSTKVDATIMVVQAQETHRDAAKRSLDALRSVHARILGAVFNKVSADDHGSYGYSYRYGAPVVPAKK